MTFNLGSRFIYSLNRNLNKNNPKLIHEISKHMSEKYNVNQIDLLKIPYTDLNIRNQKPRKITLTKNFIKKIIGKEINNNSHLYNYQHLIGKR